MRVRYVRWVKTWATRAWSERGRRGTLGVVVDISVGDAVYIFKLSSPAEWGGT